MKSLGESLDSRQNNFNLVRLVAALAVLFFHAWQFETKLPGIADPVTRKLLDWGVGLGDLAVGVFFFLSGLFVSLSWVRDPRVGPFLMRRAARLLPGLVVCLVVTTVLAVTFFSVQGVAGLLSWDPWHYVVHNALLHELRDKIPRDQHFIPGVFTRFDPPDIDGPLWTLFWEVKAYLLLAALGWAAMFGTPRRWLGLCAVVGIALSLTAPPVFEGFYWEQRLLILFLSGVAVAMLLGDVLVPRWEALVVAALLLPLARGPAIFAVYLVGCLAALLVGAKDTILSRHVARHDYSYAVYIYHAPVMQMIRNASGPIGHWELLATALVATGALAVLSWHFVERPALAWTAEWLKRREGVAPRPESVPEKIGW